MSLRDEVRELLTLPDNEDGYECDPTEVEVALTNFEAEEGKIDDLPEGTDAEDIAEKVYSAKKHWTHETE